jgi:hypothetical protein
LIDSNKVPPDTGVVYEYVQSTKHFAGFGNEALRGIGIRDIQCNRHNGRITLINFRELAASNIHCQHLRAFLDEQFRYTSPYSVCSASYQRVATLKLILNWLLLVARGSGQANACAFARAGTNVMTVDLEIDALTNLIRAVTEFSAAIMLEPLA